MKKQGQLMFHDAGGKFNSAKHSILNLTDDTDICIYSLTEKGNTTPHLADREAGKGRLDGALSR